MARTLDRLGMYEDQVLGSPEDASILDLTGLLELTPAKIKKLGRRVSPLLSEVLDPPVLNPVRSRSVSEERNRLVPTYDGRASLPSSIASEILGDAGRRRLASNLTAAEVYGLSANPRPIQAMDAVKDYPKATLGFVSPRHDVMIDPKNLAAMASAGAAKKGWYEASYKAITDVFGPEDGARFTALLAATSPQTSVESNLYNTLNIWKNWTNAGRPKGRKEILQIMGASVQGNKGEDSVLEAWRNNSIRALTQKDPKNIKISGPKVQSFYENLIGKYDEVTNDTWMGRAMNLLQSEFGGAKKEVEVGRDNFFFGEMRYTEDLGVKDKAYNSLNAATREAAKLLSQQTGVEWSPANVQEAVWSYVKTAVDFANSKESGGMNVKDVIDAGVISPEMISQTPDFATLLLDPAYGGILAGADDPVLQRNLANLQPGTFGASVPLIYQERMPQVAQMLFDVNRAKADTGSIYLPYETIPGKASGMFSQMLEKTRKAKKLREEYSADPRSDYTTESGVDRLAELAAGKAASPVRDAYGAYVNSEGVLEENPLRVPGVVFGEDNKKAEEQDMLNKMTAIQAFRGAMDIQEGSPVSFPKPMRTEGSSTAGRIYLDGPITPNQFASLRQAYPGLQFSDTGTGVTATNFDINWGDPAEVQKLESDIESLVSNQKFLNRTFGKGTRARKSNLDGAYIDYSRELATPNEGRLSRAMLKRFADPALKRFRSQVGADPQLRRMVQEKVERDIDFSKRKGIGPLRQDVQNMRRAFSGDLVEDYPEMEGYGGFEGIQRALDLGIPMADTALGRFRSAV